MAAFGQYQFGPGRAWVIQMTDNAGNAVSPLIPRRIGAVQEVSLDIDQASKPGYGGSEVALVQAPSPMKLTAKFKFLQLAAQPLNQLLLGNDSSPSAGMTLVAVDEAHTPGSTTQTITPPNSGTFAYDLGVRYADNSVSAPGTPLKRVASAGSTAGQYSVSGAVYTIKSTDEVPLVWDYAYTVTTGNLIQVQQTEIGSTPFFQIYYRGVLNGKQASFILYNVVSDKLALASKLDNYNMPELDVTVFEPTGILGTKIIDINLADV